MLQMIPSIVIKNADKLKFLVTENSTTVLTGMGVSGTVATAYLTGSASFKAARIIQEERITKIAERVQSPEDTMSIDELRVDLPTWEKVKLVWPQSIPAVGAGVTTIASIIMANRISSKTIAALTVASGISQKAFEEYKEKVIEKFGENMGREYWGGNARGHY